MATDLKSSLKKILPKSVLDDIRDFRRYRHFERPGFVRTAVMRRLGVAPKLVPATSRSFLFVCYGNILRSPMCEALMNRALAGMAGFRVTSAGLNATPGGSAHPWGIEAAREFGVSLGDHRARLLTSAMVESADAVLVMDFQNYVQLLGRHPTSKPKTYFLGGYASPGQTIEIRDPYHLGRQRTSACYRVLNTCISNLVQSVLDGRAICSDSPY